MAAKTPEKTIAVPSPLWHPEVFLAPETCDVGPETVAKVVMGLELEADCRGVGVCSMLYLSLEFFCFTQYVSFCCLVVGCSESLDHCIQVWPASPRQPFLIALRLNA